MLQQILKEMYIDPDVLEALNEDQKKTLFLKMRQEQVRRWKEREEKLEREGGDAECKRMKPKKANTKSVTWMLGRDGDVAVFVIGEVDELTSKFICAGLGEKKPQSLQSNTNHQTILKSRKNPEPVKTERENISPKSQPGISLNLKEKCDDMSTLHHLPVSVSEHSSPPAAEKPESKPADAIEETTSAPRPSVSSGPPTRAGPLNVRPASANATPGSITRRSQVENVRPAGAATPSAGPESPVKKDSGTILATNANPTAREPQKHQESQSQKGTGVPPPKQRAGQREAGWSEKAPSSAGRGRVAQLMKTFSTETPAASTKTTTPPRGVKPPLPTKPSHLRLTTTPTIR
ncbi:uncharacterized protein zgc:100829 isoform X2 [Antennarius striatus]|uniref:uncharacterized protein zgc:100829 isoform X2 n=1 Tax=Antennarius striatus TaxID=241820 RepID=UPI0035B1FDDC